MPLLPQCYCTLRHPHPDAGIKRNHELYEALAHTGYNVRTRTFMPKQVSLIVQYLDEP